MVKNITFLQIAKKAARTQSKDTSFDYALKANEDTPSPTADSRGIL
jgi:hypothetical protein